MSNSSKQLERVAESLEKVPHEIKQMVFEMAQSMSEMEIIQLFNQQARDLFTLMGNIAKRLRRQKEQSEVTAYKNLFENALKINAKLPIDKFTLVMLEYAAEIYAENEDCFLNMPIPDANVNVNNEFNIIRSDMFKHMWRIIEEDDKKSVKDIMLPLTTYAHAFLYKIILSKK